MIDEVVAEKSKWMVGAHEEAHLKNQLRLLGSLRGQGLGLGSLQCIERTGKEEGASLLPLTSAIYNINII